MLAQPSTTDSSLKLASQVFDDGTTIPMEYSCKGQNTSPPLKITTVPANAKSLALIVHDPDAVSGDFVHWLIWDIAASTQSIAANSLPEGAVEGSNDANQSKYLGPCPPPGTGMHHYKFELYALDKFLGLEPNANRNQLQRAMSGHIIAQHTLTGLFGAQ